MIDTLLAILLFMLVALLGFGSIHVVRQTLTAKPPRPFEAFFIFLVSGVLSAAVIGAALRLLLILPAITP